MHATLPEMNWSKAFSGQIRKSSKSTQVEIGHLLKKIKWTKDERKRSKDTWYLETGGLI